MLYTKFQSLQFSIKSGEALVPALIRQKGKFQKTGKYIEKGFTLAEASKKAGFNKFICSLLEAGEETGELETTVQHIAETLKIQHYYRKNISFSYLKAMAFIIGGFIAITLFFNTFNLDKPEIFNFIFTVAVSFMTITYTFFILAQPGFTKWLLASTLSFAVKAGLSFTETKKLLRVLGLPFKNKTTDYTHLTNFGKKYNDLVEAGEKTGELENSYKIITEELFTKLKKRLNLYEKLFFYTGIVIAMALILFGISQIASSGFDDL
jgi:type II secretory pathway component PulF